MQGLQVRKYKTTKLQIKNKKLQPKNNNVSKFTSNKIWKTKEKIHFKLIYEKILSSYHSKVHNLTLSFKGRIPHTSILCQTTSHT